MAAVLNRTTLQYLPSAHTPDYAPEDWIFNPDLSGVSGVPQIYWKISGDSVLEMTSPEKAAVDAAIAAAAATADREGAKAEVDMRLMKALVMVLIDEINILRGWTVSFKAEAAAATNLANFQSRIATLATLSDRTEQQARDAIKEEIDEL